MRTQFRKTLEVATALLLVLPIGILAPMMTPGWGFLGQSISPGFAYFVTGVMGILAGLCYSHIYGPRYYLVYAIGLFVAAIGGLTLNSSILSQTNSVFKFVMIISTAVGVVPGFILGRFLKKIQDMIYPPSALEFARHRQIDEERKWEAKAYNRAPSLDEIKQRLKYRSTVIVLFLLALIPPVGFIASLLVYQGSRGYGYARRVAFTGMCFSIIILVVYGCIYSYINSMGTGNKIEEIGDKIASMTEIKRDAGSPNSGANAAARVDPNDVNSQIDVLQHGDERRKQIALSILAMQADPKKASPQQVKTVAKTMKQLAFDKKQEPSTRTMAIQGMVRWGGSFSVPLLLQLLDDNDETIQIASLHQLGILKDPSALDIVVQRYASDKWENSARLCLEAYGDDAEPAVIKCLSKADKPQLKRLVDYLRDHGTEKSIAPLQSLRSRWSFFDSALTNQIDFAISSIQRGDRRNGNR